MKVGSLGLVRWAWSVIGIVFFQKWIYCEIQYIQSGRMDSLYHLIQYENVVIPTYVGQAVVVNWQ